MARDTWGRRFLAALADATPAFRSPPFNTVTTSRSMGRRFLAALADATPAFRPNGDCDEYTPAPRTVRLSHIPTDPVPQLSPPQRQRATLVLPIATVSVLIAILASFYIVSAVIQSPVIPPIPQLPGQSHVLASSSSDTGVALPVAFSPDGRILATGAGGEGVQLWDVATEHQVGTTLDNYSGSLVDSVAFSPDGEILATGSQDDTVRLWNVADPRHPAPLGLPLTGHTNSVLAVAFSPDGETLATGSQDDTVRLWNVTDPTHPAPLGPPLTSHNSVSAVAFSPDGKTLATGGGVAQLWDVTTERLIEPIDVNFGPVESVAFSPDGKTLATGGGVAQLWDVTTHQAGPILVHSSAVESVAFSPDGKTLAAGNVDGTVQLWNVVKPAQPTVLGQPLTGHVGAVRSVAFGRDGRTLATSDDHTVRLWTGI